MKNRSWMLIPLLAFTVILLALPAFGGDLSASGVARAPTGNRSLNVEKKVIICPCSYHPKAETVESFFDYQSSKGTQLYSKYRKTAVN